MRHLLVVTLPWVLSANTIIGTYLLGSKYKNTWLIFLFGSFLWIVWIIASRTWGLLPMNLFLTAIQIRNHRRWTREEVADKEERLKATVEGKTGPWKGNSVFSNGSTPSEHGRP